MIPETSAKPKSLRPLQLARIVWVAFLCAGAGYIALAHFMQKPHSQTAPSPALSWSFAAMGAL
jgi:hypothetical protein